MPPLLSMTRRMRFAIEGTSLLELGYEAQAFKRCALNASNDLCVGSSFSMRRNFFSAHAQTFSCGFMSGECATQFGSTDMPPARIAIFAAGPCKTFSPSRSTLNSARPGNDFFKNGTTFAVTSAAHFSVFHGSGTKKQRLLPFDVVIPKTFCFLKKELITHNLMGQVL